MKKIVLWIFVVLLTATIKINPLAAEPSVDELLDLILNNNTTPPKAPVLTAATTPTTIAPTTPVFKPTTPVSTTTSSSTLPVWKEPSSDEEFKSAIGWMYTNGLTQFSTPDKFEPYNWLTRQQAAKFFVVMQETVLWQVPVTNNTACTFSDGWFDSSLRTFVDKACAYWILKWSNGVYRPTVQISKPEFITALVRMIEWAKRDETWNPRWSQYYQQAKNRWLTKELNANAFDATATRYEAALFLYRSLAVLRQSNIQHPTTPVNTITTTGSNTGNQSENPVAITPSQPVTPSISDPTLQESIYWMRDNGMTKFSTVEQYRPFDTLQRQEAAKIFTLFRNTILQWTPSSDGTSCAFDDLSIADQSLVTYIKQACKLQILKWSNGLFNPEWLLTKPQAIAILIRMIEWPQSETGANRWQVYYDKAVVNGMIEPSQSESFDKPISRYEIAKILYNSKVKYALIRNLNNNYETNKLIYPVPNTQTTWSNTGEIKWLVSINTQILSRSDIDTYLVDLFWNQYKLERQATQKYLNSDYVWYGKVISIDETQNIGTSAFTISNGVIIDGVIRPYLVEQANYFLTPSVQQPYYDMVKKPK
jgi:hypothetical protein